MAMKNNIQVKLFPG